MTDYGCFRIAEEQATHEKLRPEWKHIIDNMCRGDELVVANSAMHFVVLVNWLSSLRYAV